jgi:hypothetical protein
MRKGRSVTDLPNFVLMAADDVTPDAPVQLDEDGKQ